MNLHFSYTSNISTVSTSIKTNNVQKRDTTFAGSISSKERVLAFNGVFAEIWQHF